MTRLSTIPTSGPREIHLTIEHPGELVLSVAWPTAVHPEARVLLDEASARALRDELSAWLGE